MTIVAILRDQLRERKVIANPVALRLIVQAAKLAVRQGANPHAAVKRGLRETKIA